MSPLMSLVLSSLALLADPAGVSGIVVDDRGAPVADAAVMLTAFGPQQGGGPRRVLASATADKSGRFRLDAPKASGSRGLPDGTIWAHRPGLAFGTASYSARAATPDLKITLAEPSRCVVVLKRQDGSPLEGVAITPIRTVAPNLRGNVMETLPEGLGTRLTATTDRNGEAVFESFADSNPPRVFRVRSAATGTQMLPAADPEPARTRRVEFVIQPAGSVRGKVVLRDGKPPRGIRVALERQGQGAEGVEPVVPAGGPVLTGEDGSFESPPILLADGRYRVTIQADGYAPASSDWIAPAGPGAAAEVRPIALRPLVAIEGRVVDRQGKPVPGAEVSQAGDGPLHTSTRADPDGRFRLGGYNAPRGFVFAAAEGFRFGGAILKEGKAGITLTRLTEAPPRPLTHRTPPLPPKELRDIAFKALTPFIIEALKEDQMPFGSAAIGALGLIDPVAAIKTLEPLEFSMKEWTGGRLATLLAPEDLAGATELAGRIKDPTFRVVTLFGMADSLPKSRKADRAALLKQALTLLREQASKEEMISLFGEVGERLAEEGEAEESRKAFDEGLALGKAILSTRDGLEFTAYLAGARPDAALALIAEMDQKSLSREVMVGVVQRLARHRPKAAAKLFASMEAFGQFPPLLALETMAAADPATAAEVLETRVDPKRRGDGRLIIAHGLARRDPAEAERVFRQAIREMVEADTSPSTTLKTFGYHTSFVEEVSPSLVPEYLWFVLSMRPPATDADRQALPRDLQMLAIAAQYDPEIAAEIWREIEAPLRAEIESRGSIGDAVVVEALAWLDPKQALEWVEARRGPRGTKGVPPGDRSRLTLAEILGKASRGRPQRLLQYVLDFSDQLRKRAPQ